MDTAASSSRLRGPGPDPWRMNMSRGIVIPEAPSDSNSLWAVTLDRRKSTNVGDGKRTMIFIQDDCLKHRYIRSRDVSEIVERPERLHAVKLGLAAAISRIEEVESVINPQKPERVLAVAGTDDGDLAAALARMAIAPPTGQPAPSPSSPLRTGSVMIRRTSASIPLLNNASAVRLIHGDLEEDGYLGKLIEWARDSKKNISEKGTEIPEGMPPLDLYLCPGSIAAIQGAIGAVCEAVDASVLSTRRTQLNYRGPDDPCERAFVAIRPPGHHCGEDTPSGFCFVNNVAVAATHAYIKHCIGRIIVLDIDLHHGNGTQSIVWQTNEETYQQTLEDEELGVETRPSRGGSGPRIFYGSLHDILSFPCEDGKPEMVQAASTSIHGPHGQYIENIHLQKYDSEAHFWDVLYPRYLTLLHRARDFLDETGGPGEDVMVFISCGFDASEHEYPSMSRHGRKVPVGFYHRFTRETCKLADVYARGRVVSVLEGGYSDRALTSGAMAHLCGLVDLPGQASSSDPDRWVDEAWWSESNLVKLEKAAKPRKSASSGTNTEEWIARTLDLLSVLNGNEADTPVKSSSARGAGVGTESNTPPTSMTLRERKKPVLDSARAGGALPDSARSNRNGGRSVSAAGKKPAGRSSTTSRTSSAGGPTSESSRGETESQEEPPSNGPEKKKLPRVILHVRPPPGETTS